MAGVINEPGQHSEQSPATLGAAMDADRNTTRDATRIRLHLGRRTRKAVLTFHIATAGSWLGSTSSSPSSCSPVCRPPIPTPPCSATRRYARSRSGHCSPSGCCA